MIDLRDLRVGNIFNVDGNYWHVSSIITDNNDLVELYFKENEEYNHILNVKPIIITEEILLECGFSVLKEFSAGKKYAFIVNNCYNDSISFIVWYIDNKIVCNIPHLKYLHQLQNAVFTLTSQEIKL